MSPYILTSSPAGHLSSSLTSTASPAHLPLPTTTSEKPLLGHASSTLVPTRSLVGLPKDWALLTGCASPGSDFWPPFANSDGFPTSWFSRGWDMGNSCAWFDPTSSSTSTSGIPSPTSVSPSPAKASLSTNTIIGIAVGAGVVAVLLAGWLVFCIMRRRRHRGDASDSASASLLPVAYPYPIPRPRGSRTSGSTRPSPTPSSELRVEAAGERNTAGVGAVESKSLANCSVVPLPSVPSPPPGSVLFAAPGVPEGPCRAEKALMQLRARDRRPPLARGAGAPPTDGGGIAAEAHPPEDGVGAGLDVGNLGCIRLEGGQEDGRDVGLAADADHASDLDSGSDSRTTLPPPYSSHHSFEQPRGV